MRKAIAITLIVASISVHAGVPDVGRAPVYPSGVIFKAHTDSGNIIEFMDDENPAHQKSQAIMRSGRDGKIIKRGVWEEHGEHGLDLTWPNEWPIHIAPSDLEWLGSQDGLAFPLDLINAIQRAHGSHFQFYPYHPE